MGQERERFAGSLLGLCLGDALGFPVEGHSPAVCAAYVEGLRAGRRHGRHGFPFGQVTDDSQLARELVLSWVECGGFEPDDYARRIAGLFVRGEVVGYGRSTRRAALRLADGVPWPEAGTPPPMAGNGGAMRAAPVGLLCAGDLDRLVAVADTQARITHADPRARAGAVAVAAATALALEATAVQPDRWIERIAEASARVDRGFGEQVRRLERWLSLAPEAAAPELARAGLEPGEEPDWRGISPFVVPSVLWSLYAFLRHPDDWCAAVYEAIAVGGDVDTTAAMTGAIAGAWLGAGALPEQDLERIEDRGRWRRADLEALAELAWRVARR